MNSLDKDLSLISDIFDDNPYILSDTHFFHDRVYKDFEPIRQTFAGTREDFDEKMLNLMKTQNPFIHLGDVVINSKDLDKFSNRIRLVGHKLQGTTKVLIMGNHDRGGDFLFEKTGWIVVSCGIDLAENKIYKNAPPFVVKYLGTEKVMFSHEPLFLSRKMEESQYTTDVQKRLGIWAKRLNITKNIHGHVHSHSLSDPMFVNVSIEAISFSPQKIKSLFLDKQTRPMASIATPDRA